MVNVPMMHFGGLYIPRELGEGLIKLIEENNEIEAIRLLRENAGIDLKTAKNAVDCYKKENDFNEDNESQKGKGAFSRTGKMIIVICILILVGVVFRNMLYNAVESLFLKPVIYLYP